MSSISQYKIGIGITSYKRPEMLNKCLEHIHKYSEAHQLYVAVDKEEDRRGVAYRKNECLRALKDCDYIFLLDDDTYPIAKGWEQFFINSGYQHLLYLTPQHNYLKTINGDAKVYRDCGGVFMFMTKSIVDKVGAFDEKFELWGMEHCDYSVRIIGKHGEYPCLINTNKYIYAHDYSDVAHKSSISNEEKNLLFKKNFPKFEIGTQKKYIPL